MTAAQALHVLQEKQRRDAGRTGLVAAAFKQQRAFIEDESRFKAALCTRRAGKTYGIGLYLFREALLNPGTNCLYLAKSTASARNMITKDVLFQIDKQFGLGMRVNYARMELHMPNGSVIYVAGADSNAGQMHRVVGMKYRLAVVDECQYWNQVNLRRMVLEGLRPTLMDWQGTLCLIGVPCATRDYFWEVSDRVRNAHSGELLHPEWSVHRWSGLDNPHQSRQFKEELAEIKKNNPLFMQTPTFRQQYLGEWIDDPDARCYRFEDSVNRIAALPGNPDDYHWVLGVDVGYSPDPMAFVVCAYDRRNKDQCLYVVHAHKQKEMLIDDVGDYVHELEQRFPISQYVIDGANKNVRMELVKRLKIPFDAAQKQGGKNEFIHLITDDLMSAKVKLVGDGADGLADEWMKLVWERPAPTKGGLPKPAVPSRAYDDHLADAFLYAWRHCYHYIKPEVEQAPPEYGTTDWVSARERRLAERLAQSEAESADSPLGLMRRLVERLEDLGR